VVPKIRRSWDQIRLRENILNPFSGSVYVVSILQPIIIIDRYTFYTFMYPIIIIMAQKQKKIWWRHTDRYYFNIKWKHIKYEHTTIPCRHMVGGAICHWLSNAIKRRREKEMRKILHAIFINMWKNVDNVDTNNNIYGLKWNKSFSSFQFKRLR
jgi:hypothetical protein